MPVCVVHVSRLLLTISRKCVTHIVRTSCLSPYLKCGLIGMAGTLRC